MFGFKPFLVLRKKKSRHNSTKMACDGIARLLEKVYFFGGLKRLMTSKITMATIPKVEMANPAIIGSRVGGGKASTNAIQIA